LGHRICSLLLQVQHRPSLRGAYPKSPSQRVLIYSTGLSSQSTHFARVSLGGTLSISLGLVLSFLTTFGLTLWFESFFSSSPTTLVSSYHHLSKAKSGEAVLMDRKRFHKVSMGFDRR
jgi:hypothetical protein